MRWTSLSTLAVGTLLTFVTLGAQGLQPSQTPWRGAGSTPCVGSDGGFYKCPPPPSVIAVRAGRLV